MTGPELPITDHIAVQGRASVRDHLVLSAILGALFGWLAALETGLIHRPDWWTTPIILLLMVAHAVDWWVVLRWCENRQQGGS